MVDESAEGQPGPPRLGEVFNLHVVVTRRVSLAPFQQLFEAADGVLEDKHRQTRQDALQPLC